MIFFFREILSPTLGDTLLEGVKVEKMPKALNCDVNMYKVHIAELFYGWETDIDCNFLPFNLKL